MKGEVGQLSIIQEEKASKVLVSFSQKFVMTYKTLTLKTYFFWRALKGGIVSFLKKLQVLGLQLY